MDLLSNLMLGLSVSLTLQNIFYCFIGCLLGTLVGVLPGLGPVTTLAMLLPITYGMEPVTSLIMLAGIYYGAQYGGSTSAILMNVPGEVSSAITVIDGHQMARNGRGGVALATAALSSLFAGIVGTLILAAFAVPMTKLALQIHSPEYFSLMILGLLGACVLASGSVLKSISMVVLGLLLSLVGIDGSSGVVRMTFGLVPLMDGIEFVALAMGMYAFADIIITLGGKKSHDGSTSPIRSFMPTRDDFRRMVPAMFRGTLLGSLLGPLPGAGPSIASFASYAIEKKTSRHGEEFGQGAIEGVAGPEAANNGAAQTSFIPTLTLGIPGSATLAVLLAGMMIHNIQPGPRVISSHPEVFWGLVVSMFIGNIILVLLNLPLAPLWVQLLRLPYKFLYPAILVICCIGIYSIDNAVFGIYCAALFGLVGYVLVQLRCSPAPLILGFVLGPLLEVNFRRSLVIAKGDYSVFLTRPISAVFLALAVALLVFMVVPVFRKSRAIATQD